MFSRHIAAALVLAGSLIRSEARAASPVSCVGDSITAGDGASSAATSYPSVLQSLLGNGFTVQNAGHSGATLMNAGDLPYTSVGEYPASVSFVGQGGDVVIQLGTNDSKPANWSASGGFLADCKAMVGVYLAGGKTRVWLNLPPPARSDACCSIDGAVIANGVIPLLKSCASAMSVPTIDVYGAMSSHTGDLVDGVHPNDAGAAVIAQTVHDALAKAPSVTLAGSGGSISVMLTAQPVAAYGKVERVVFFEGTSERASVLAAPWTAALTGVSAGLHRYRAEVIETAGRSASSAEVEVEVAVADAAASAAEGGNAAPDAGSGSGNVTAPARQAANPSDASSPAGATDASGCVTGRVPHGSSALALGLLLLLAGRRRLR